MGMHIQVGRYLIRKKGGCIFIRLANRLTGKHISCEALQRLQRKYL